MSVPIWLITGCSSGFGASLALLALRNGHHVIATSRTPSKSPELVSEVEKLGGKWLSLDVCGGNIADVVQEATNLYGRIDILVNNAAYALLGAFETIRLVKKEIRQRVTDRSTVIRRLENRWTPIYSAL
jgi:NAD(P)-dependent dehydrogenase (short-subunit alcohol dehydrogenase family)